MGRARLAALAALAFAACSGGDPIVPANFRGPVAVVPYRGFNPAQPDLGLVPLLAVASFRGDEIQIIDPSTDRAIQAPNLAYSLAVPTLPRPRYLASGDLGDGGADLLVVASSGATVQLIGTWLDGTSGFGVVETWNLASIAGEGAQVLALAVLHVPTGPPAGTPPVAPVATGTLRLVVALNVPGNVATGQIVVLDLARQPDGSIQLAGVPSRRLLSFAATELAASPDNVHLYASTLDVIQDDLGKTILGVAEFDASGASTSTWPLRALETRGAPTLTVAAAYVGERTQANFYTFAAPVLRVYASLDRSGCGPDHDIACGIVTLDPSTGGVAPDPAPPGPPGWPVQPQTYRTPLYMPSLPTALAVAMPASIAASGAPGTPFGSQVCFSPAVPGVGLPACPSVAEEPTSPSFNGKGAPQSFLLTAPATGQLWTSVVALATAVDGNAYVQDLGRFGPVNAISMLNDDTTRTQAAKAAPVGPAGPVANSGLFGFPANTTALGLWSDNTSSTDGPSVVTTTTELDKAILVWPGFTRDDVWLVSYQGVIPGLAQRRAVLGLDAASGLLYLGIQDAAVPAPLGELPADSYWVTGAFVEAPELGVHTTARNGPPGDIAQLLLDVDPCASTRPNWIPSGSTTPVYDPTKPPMAHETTVRDSRPPDPVLYPGGALLLGPAADATLAQEYACLVAWFATPANAGKVLTMFHNATTSPEDYARGAWVRASGLLLAGSSTGYAGRPELDVRYDLAWSDESGLSGEALVLARKARRFYYPSAYPNRSYGGYPGMTDPMQPGPALQFRVGRYCPTNFVIEGCNAQTSPPARDAGIQFVTASGLVSMQRRPTGTSGGNWVTTFDKSTIPGQEYRGNVFYTTYIGETMMMVPPGLDVGQTVIIR